MEIAEIVKKQIKKLREQLDKNELALGEITFNNGGCQILSQSPIKYELIVSDETSRTGCRGKDSLSWTGLLSYRAYRDFLCSTKRKACLDGK